MLWWLYFKQMPASDTHTILHRVDEIHKLIAGNEVPRAIRRSMDFIKEFSNDKDLLKKILVISSQYHRINQELSIGIAEYAYADRARNQILFGMLTLIDQVHSSYSPQMY